MNKIDLFSDDNAIGYEYLIRAAHQCGRHGVTGAHADSFRALLNPAKIYLDAQEKNINTPQRLWSQSEEDMLSNYMASAGEVSGYLYTAFDQIKKAFDSKLTDEHHQKIEQAEIILIKPTLERIVDSIAIVEKVLQEINQIA